MFLDKELGSLLAVARNPFKLVHMEDGAIRPPPLTIAFCGPKGAGKDTAASYFHNVFENSPHYKKQINFADPLKASCMLKYGLTYEECYTPELKETKLARWPYVTPRYLMQTEAETSRVIFPEIWVEAWKIALRRVPWQIDLILNTDLRYPNELEALREQPNNLLIYIHNPTVEALRLQGIKNEDPLWCHQSEKYAELLVDEADLVVLNDGHSLNNLFHRLASVTGLKDLY